MSTPVPEWFTTTPEAILRAESILTAFREGREHDIGPMLAWDQSGETNPVHLMVALITMGDRVADYAAHLAQRHALQDATPQTIIREAARTVAEAVYTTPQQDQDGSPDDT